MRTSIVILSSLSSLVVAHGNTRHGHAKRTLAVDVNIQDAAAATVHTTKQGSDAQSAPPLVHVTPESLPMLKDQLGFIAPSTISGNLTFSYIGAEPEPINTIISSASWFAGLPGVPSQSDSLLEKLGFAQYLSALNISTECLGLALTDAAFATVDGSNAKHFDFAYGDNFGDHIYGTCEQAQKGGLKVMGWRQSLSGAFFLGNSIAAGLEADHAPVSNGYDAGRNEFTRRALMGGIDTLQCVWPPAKVITVQGLVENDEGCEEHEFNHNIGTNGLVNVITIGKPHCPFSIDVPVANNRTNGTYVVPKQTKPNSTPLPMGPLGVPTNIKPSITQPKSGLPKTNGAQNINVAKASVFGAVILALLSM